ncbi:hypothetical protein D1872_200510 [compost metagenome]
MHYIKLFLNEQYIDCFENKEQLDYYLQDKKDLIIVGHKKTEKELYFMTLDYFENFEPPIEDYNYIPVQRNIYKGEQENMIDFTELSSDGVAFEQLIRELVLREGYEAHWTGVGPDQGRDLIVVEKVLGPLSSFQRTWLIECKHYAKANKSVGINDLSSIIDSCSAAGADGYILACSTQPSSSLVRKFNELQNSKGLKIIYWDAIEIEKRLFNPECFALIHMFFPKSSESIGWKIYNSDSPSFWAANYKEHFIYLSSRVAMTFPDLRDCEKILEIIDNFPILPKNQFLRPRAIFFDNKHEQFRVYVDYMVSEDDKVILSPKELNEYFNDGMGLYEEDNSMCYLTYWDVNLVKIRPNSDHYHRDSKGYYEPFIEKFKSGGSRNRTLSDMIFLNNYF